MLWVIYCLSKPHSEAEELRAKIRHHHHNYLSGKEDAIFMVAPLLSRDGAENIGGLWIIKANSYAEALAFSDNEPYTKAGVFSSVTITRLREGNMRLHPAAAGSECVEYLKKQKL